MLLGLIFAGYVQLWSQYSFLNIIVFSWWPIIDPHLIHFWANNCLTLEVPKKFDPILVTLLKRRPHYIQLCRENPILSSGTYTPPSPSPPPLPDQ